MTNRVVEAIVLWYTSRTLKKIFTFLGKSQIRQHKKMPPRSTTRSMQVRSYRRLLRPIKVNLWITLIRIKWIKRYRILIKRKNLNSFLDIKMLVNMNLIVPWHRSYRSTRIFSKCLKLTLWPVEMKLKRRKLSNLALKDTKSSRNLVSNVNPRLKWFQNPLSHLSPKSQTSRSLKANCLPKTMREKLNKILNTKRPSRLKQREENSCQIN